MAPVVEAATDGDRLRAPEPGGPEPVAAAARVAHGTRLR